MYGSPYSQMMQQQPQGPMVQTQPMRGIQPMPQDAPPPPKQSGGGMMGGMMSGMMGGMGGGASGGMGAMLSDRNSKEQIQKLSTQNAALTQALGNKVGSDGLTDERRNWYAEQEHKARGTSASGDMSTDLARWASMGGFGDSPAASRVAAQNASLGGGSPAQHSPTGMPAPAPPQAAPEKTALSEQGVLPPTEYPRLPQNTRVAPMNSGGSTAPAAAANPTVWDTIKRSNPNLEALDAAYRDLSRGA